MKKLLLVIGLAGVALFGWVLLSNMRQPRAMGEIIPPDEDATTSAIIGSAMHLVNTNHDLRYQKSGDKLYRRDVHAKMQGLLRAIVTVKSELPAQYRYGVFRDPPKDGYHAWVRFSNGDPALQSDTVKDAHGMALKLMGVPGPKLLPGEEDAQTQDFVMTSHPVFPVATIEEYGDLMRYAADGKINSYLIRHPRSAWIAFWSLISPPGSVLNLQFYSQSAYRLGPNQYVKFSAKPCSTLPSPDGVDRSKFNFLREVIKKQLQQSDACFDLMIQIQDPNKDMPVEDPTVRWSESDSPFFPVAQIRILKNDNFDTPERDMLAENLSFMPWHALPDHQPVGALNRLRKAVYQQISGYRRAKNGMCLLEPKDWDPPCPARASP